MIAWGASEEIEWKGVDGYDHPTRPVIALLPVHERTFTRGASPILGLTSRRGEKEA